MTTLLLLSLPATSIFISLLDLKHHLPVSTTPHLYPWFQLSRLLIFQLASLSSTEVLLSAVLIYQFRVLERLWGTRKYASFVLVAWTSLTVLTPTLLLVLKVLTLGWWNYLPPGVTGIVWAGLAAWSGSVPGMYRYKVLATTDADERGGNAKGVTLSDKATSYFIAVQLALSQFPYGLVPAAAGWVVGSAYMGDMLPMGLGRSRVPRWVVGEGGQGKRGGREFEGLRRRLEEEGARDGMRAVTSAGGVQQEEQGSGGGRGMLGRFAGYFSGS